MEILDEPEDLVEYAKPPQSQEVPLLAEAIAPAEEEEAKRGVESTSVTAASKAVTHSDGLTVTNGAVAPDQGTAGAAAVLGAHLSYGNKVPETSLLGK